MHNRDMRLGASLVIFSLSIGATPANQTGIRDLKIPGVAWVIWGWLAMTTLVFRVPLLFFGLEPIITGT
ncbi:MAG: hypothetical protein HY644_06245 [Acidobacteria bacterium]|nr:hypothetical protein [Acidobacteriota bacterium]